MAEARSPFLGILKLDTRFPRPIGDTGNPASFDFPVRHAIVAGAHPHRVVTQGAAGMLEPFVEAGRRLVDEGACAIATTCGFLAIYQREMAAALPVPVATSALMQVPWVRAIVGTGRRVGVLTISPESITPAHLAGVGIEGPIPMAGVSPEGEFRTKILGDQPTLDVDAACADVVAAARALVAAHADLGAIVMECTNMPPYREAVRAATGLPVFDALTLAEWLWRATGSPPAAPRR